MRSVFANITSIVLVVLTVQADVCPEGKRPTEETDTQAQRDHFMILHISGTYWWVNMSKAECWTPLHNTRISDCSWMNSSMIWLHKSRIG